MMGWVYNLDKDLYATSWSPSLTGVYFELILDVIKGKKIRLNRVQTWGYEKVYLERDTKRYNDEAKEEKYLREMQ